MNKRLGALKTRARLLPLALGLSLMAGCTADSTKFANRPVIKVNEETMSLVEFSEKLARALRKFDALTAKDPQNLQRAKDEILRTFIMDCLVESYSKAQKITLKDGELKNEINQIRKSYPDDVSFRNTLAKEDLTLTEWTDQMRKTLLQKAVFGQLAKKITDPNADEILQYYNLNKDRFHFKERVYLRQIVTDDLGKAAAIKEELKKGDFVSLATKYSVSPEAKLGGLVGWIEKGDVDVFDKAFSMSVGAVSPILESNYGFHIFKVEKKSPSGYSSLEEVKPLILQELRAQKEQAEFAVWLDRQIRASHVYKDVDLIRAVNVETRGP